MHQKFTQSLATDGYPSARQRDKSHNFSAPLNALTNGRLVFAAGAMGVTLYGDPGLATLYCAHFVDHLPRVGVQAGVITLQYDPTSSCTRSAPLHETRATIALNGAIPWEVECRGGLAGLIADLRDLPLRALDLGSVSGAALALPAPPDTVFIYLAGSVSDMVIYRPWNVAVRIQINGSASHLMFDEQYLGAVINGIRWQSDDYKHTTARYDISITGSASHMTIATWRPEAGEACDENF